MRNSITNEYQLTEYLKNYSAPLNHFNGKFAKIEQKVRELDDPTITKAESAKTISKYTGFKYLTCYKYISSLRRGIHDRIYADFLARQRGFINFSENMNHNISESKNANLNLEEFREHRAKKSGFESTEDYIRYLEDRRLFFHKNTGQNRNLPQKKFEYSKLEFHDPSNLETIDPIEYNPLSYTEHQKTFWDFIQDTLSEEQYAVILSRFIEGKTLYETGKQFKLSREMIRQIEKKAIKKLKHPHRLKLLREII